MLQELERISFDIRYSDHAVLVKPEGVISLGTSTEFKRKMLELLEIGIRSLTVDIAGVRHIDSVGLATLIVLSRQCGAQGIEFFITNPADGPGRLLQSSGLAKYLLHA